MLVALVRVDASESLINGHITPLPCLEYDLLLPGICNCEGETNGCIREQSFRMSEAALLDASTALSCYANTSQLVS